MRRRRWREGGANVVKFTIFQLSPMEECRVCRWCCGAYWLVCDLDFCVYEEGNTVFLCSSFTASSFLKFLILEEISRAILFPIWGIPTLGFGAWGYNCVVLFCIFFSWLHILSSNAVILEQRAIPVFLSYLKWGEFGLYYKGKNERKKKILSISTWIMLVPCKTLNLLI